MQELDISSDELVDRLLTIGGVGLCILDSCGVGHLNSHLLLAGIKPTEMIVSDDADNALQTLGRIVGGDQAAIFTLSYDLGNLLQDVSTTTDKAEPILFAAIFDELIVHDYDTRKTRATKDLPEDRKADISDRVPAISAKSNVSRSDYLRMIDAIKEEIRSGNTYQANLTRQIEAELPSNAEPAAIFGRLRSRHPAPFSAYISRPGSTVISASPERFFKIESGKISASPIKGTRPRGSTPDSDDELRKELLKSEKDRAENTMIVDLLRNDLGRVCEFGSVTVEKLCEIEEHPSLFHLVSTINGKLRGGLKFGEIIEALFPCGSITGAPKLSTMKIINRLEPNPRGLSMGAIGYYLPASFGLGEMIDLSVAIRTMVIRDGVASFNVGGGIVIDSDPQKEWDETVTKSVALLDALGVDPEIIED